MTSTRSRSAAAGYAGALKLQAAGPWTLAANVELADRAQGASPITARCATSPSRSPRGCAQHLADVARSAARRRGPSCSSTSRRCRPCSPGACRRRPGTARCAPSNPTSRSGVSARSWRPRRTARRVVHCCASDVPIALLRAAGADAIALDLALVNQATTTRSARRIDAGLSLWLGTFPRHGRGGHPGHRARPASAPFGPRSVSPRACWPSTSCRPPPAEWPERHPAYARRVLRLLRDAGAALLDRSD